MRLEICARDASRPKLLIAEMAPRRDIQIKGKLNWAACALAAVFLYLERQRPLRLVGIGIVSPKVLDEFRRGIGAIFDERWAIQ